VRSIGHVPLRRGISSRLINDLTIIVVASPIPSHPSCEIIEETISSLSFLGNPNQIPIILAHDAPHPRSASSDRASYAEYLTRLEAKYGSDESISISVGKTWGHLIGNITEALRHVHTRYVLIVQHDLPFVRSVDLDSVLDVMNSYEQVKHVRFNKRSNIAVGYDGLTPVDAAFFEEERFLAANSTKSLSLVRTSAWSDNNHVCRKDYYGQVVQPIVGGMRLPPESINFLNSPLTHGYFGTYIYGPISGEAVIRHLDGRMSGKAAEPRDQRWRAGVRWVQNTCRLRTRIRQCYMRRRFARLIDG